MLGRIARGAVREAPRVLREVQRARGPARTRSRSRSAPPPAGGRTLVYAPQPDGRADPGEVVWTWVAYEEDPAQGKDRPVLVVGREGGALLGLMLSSQAERDGQRGWLALGPGAWDRESRPSWVRLDRVLSVDEDGVRREGAVARPPAVRPRGRGAAPRPRLGLSTPVSNTCSSSGGMLCPVAGGMGRRRDGLTLAERAAAAGPGDRAAGASRRARAPSSAGTAGCTGLRDAPGRWPGLLVEWRQPPDGTGWEGRVVYVVAAGPRVVVVEAWLAAPHLSPA